MLPHTTAFFLDCHTDVTKVSDFGIENMEQLKCRIIGECKEIQVIIDGNNMYDETNRSEIVLETWEDDKRPLGSLEYLYVYHMKSLRGIYEGPMHRGCLSHLKCLALLTCPQLTTIFSPGLLKTLDSLEDLKVEDYPLVLNLVRCEDTSIYKSTYFLPNLKKISLFSLPELISISSGLCIAPNLEQLSFIDCPNLKSPSTDGICCNHLTGTKAQSIPNDASREQPAPPVVSSTSIGNADPSTSKRKREPKVAPRLWKFLFNDLKLAARKFSAASLLGEGSSGSVSKFTNDTSKEQPSPTGISFTPTRTAIDSVSSTISDTAFTSSISPRTTSNTAFTSSISSTTTSNRTINYLTSILEEEIMVAPQLRKFSLNDLKLATRNFSPTALLGERGFGRVFKGWIEENGTAPARPGTGLTIAVKTLKPNGLQGHKEWLAEVSILGHLEHPNLVKLIGYCKEDDQGLLIYEFMQGGSLDNHIFKRGTLPLPWFNRMKIELDAAKGLAFLHEEAELQVIFRDFKTSNILLDADYNAKLSGLGLEKIDPRGDGHIITCLMGEYGYAAPEYVATGTWKFFWTLSLVEKGYASHRYGHHELVLLGDLNLHSAVRAGFGNGHLKVKSDIYSFGVVLLEILTGMRVMDPSRPSSERYLVEWARPYLKDKRKFKIIIDAKLEGLYTQEVALIASQLATRCLNRDPKLRPQMSEVVQVLEGLQGDHLRTTQGSASGGMASKVKPQ